MLKLIVIVIAIAVVKPLTVQVNNIHYGYKNIYVSNQLSLSSSQLTLNNYKLTKQDLTKDILEFISHQSHLIRVDFNKLVRKYEIEEVDTQNPLLRFQFIQRGYIVVTIFTQNQQESEIQMLNSLVNFGKDQSQLDL